mgnify:FL=1|tara:strand:+ start:1196 stop:2596 length:1401 start_codon:yes stop_codon:yes gene_type:complete
MFNLMMPWLKFREVAVFCGDGGGGGGGISDGPSGKSSNSASAAPSAAPSFSSRPQARPADLDTSPERSAAGAAQLAAERSQLAAAQKAQQEAAQKAADQKAAQQAAQQAQLAAAKKSQQEAAARAQQAAQQAAAQKAQQEAAQKAQQAAAQKAQQAAAQKSQLAADQRAQQEAAQREADERAARIAAVAAPAVTSASRPQARPADLDTSPERSAAGAAQLAAAPEQEPSGFLGGYDSVGDMIDGGGPMAEGDTFGGLLGGVSNSLGATPYGSGLEPTGIAEQVSSPMGRAAIGALAGGLPGAVMGYAAATRADKGRADRDPDKGLLGFQFGGDQDPETQTTETPRDEPMYGMGDESPTGTVDQIVAEEEVDVDPCPEGYILDAETNTCVIDPFQIPFADAPAPGSDGFVTLPPAQPQLSAYTQANPMAGLPSLSPVQGSSFSVPTPTVQQITMGQQGLASLSPRMG